MASTQAIGAAATHCEPNITRMIGSAINATKPKKGHDTLTKIAVARAYGSASDSAGAVRCGEGRRCHPHHRRTRRANERARSIRSARLNRPTESKSNFLAITGSWKLRVITSITLEATNIEPKRSTVAGLA